MPTDDKPAEPHSAAQITRQWLLDVIAITELTATGLARKAGLSPTTLTRPASDPDWPTAMASETIRKIVEATGVAPPMGYAAAAGSFREPDAMPLKPKAGADDALARALRELRGGRNAADVWEMRTRALELAGVLPGDLMIVDLNATRREGDIVCAQIYDKAADKSETVFRVLRGDILMSASLDPRHIRPYQVRDSATTIKGIVTERISRRRRDAA